MDQSNVINQQYSIRQQPSLSQSEVEKQYQFYSQSQNPSVNLAGSQQNTNLNNANNSGNFVLENNSHQSINSTNPNFAIVPTPPDIPTVPEKKSACHIM
jgi:hypothetical protein